MAGGRPSKYDDDMLADAKGYLVDFVPSITEAVPTVAGLAEHLDVSRSTVYEWAGDGDKEEFSDIVERILTRQELMLLSGGLIGTYNPTLAKLALTKHGYTDKVETKDATKKTLEEYSDEELDEYIASRT